MAFLVINKKRQAGFLRGLDDEHEALSLRPKEPEFFVDEQYIFYAIGLLSEIVPDKASQNSEKISEKSCL